eukprot:3252131-Pyramimonas_sp.AAC.1
MHGAVPLHAAPGQAARDGGDWGSRVLSKFSEWPSDHPLKSTQTVQAGWVVLRILVLPSRPPTLTVARGLIGGAASADWPRFVKLRLAGA